MQFWKKIRRLGDFQTNTRKLSGRQKQKTTLWSSSILLSSSAVWKINIMWSQDSLGISILLLSLNHHFLYWIILFYGICREGCCKRRLKSELLIQTITLKFSLQQWLQSCSFSNPCICPPEKMHLLHVSWHSRCELVWFSVWMSNFSHFVIQISIRTINITENKLLL